MKNFQKYAKIVLGCFLIAVVLNVFFKNNDLIPCGLFGFAILYNEKTGMDLSLILILANVFFYLFGLLILDKKKMRGCIIPFTIIPLFIFMTKDFGKIIDFGNADKLLIALFGGVLMGIGFKFIYKETRYASGSDILTTIAKSITKTSKYTVNYIIDIIWIIFAGYLLGIENAMYTVISILIMETLAHRANLGISDSKVFYIITKKDKEVRSYIIDELHYELTIFDVKGGFLKTKNKILMSVIPTKDYYKLKEGIKLIDPKAFISITDSYEVINSNKGVEKIAKL